MKTRLRNATAALIPLTFGGNILLNIITMLFHINPEHPVRKMIVYGVLLVVMLMALADTSWRSRRVLGVVSLSALFGLTELVRFGRLYAWDIGTYVAERSGDIFVLSFLFCVAVWTVSNTMGRTVLKMNSYYVRIMAVIAVCYLCLRFFINPEVPTWGWIDYMSIANMLLFSLLPDVIRCFFFETDNDKEYIQWICWLCMLGGICATGCKGSILCLCWFSLFMLLYSILSRSGIKRIILSLSVTAAVVLWILATLDINSRVGQAFDELTKGMSIEDGSYISLADFGLTEADLIRYNFDSIGAVREWAAITLDEGQKILSRYPEYKSPSKAVIIYSNSADRILSEYKNGLVSRTEVIRLLSDSYILNHTALGARYYLYGNALNLFLDSPLFGNGLLAYQDTVGMPAHNIFLEIMVDLGVVGMLIGIISFASLIVLVVRRDRLIADCPMVFALVMFTWFIFPENMVSGDLYTLQNVLLYGACDYFAIKMIISGKRQKY